MLGLLASLVLIFGASSVVGQAIFAINGRRQPSALAPAVGLCALLALAWGTVRLPGEGTAAAIAIGLAALAALLIVRGRVAADRELLHVAVPVAATASLLGALPFIVEIRIGILGTGLNPDMSQHLFAAERLAGDGVERLISEGYPLGPHALVVALDALGVSTVQGFAGLMLATAAATSVAALAALAHLPAARRYVAAIAVGFAYLVAANFVQGAFKESIEAMILLAFAIVLTELEAAGAPSRGRARKAPSVGARIPAGRGTRVAAGGRGDRGGSIPESAAGVGRALPLAVLALGSVYAYSFAGLAWLAGTLGVWIALRLATALHKGGLAEAVSTARAAAGPAALAGGVLVAFAAPEVGRMVSFAGFETFDPEGAGLGNLFDRLSPLEALGVWPSGDFRVEPGGGAVPAIAFYLGAALAGAALLFGLSWSLRRRESALPAAFAAALAIWLGALLAGTPYQEAKALVILAPLVVLISARGLLAAAPSSLAIPYLAATVGSALLALANGPVGPAGYSPRLAELRVELGAGSTYVYAPRELLDEQHGRDFIVWELRGNRICVERLPAGADPPLPKGASALVVVGIDDQGAVVPVRVSRGAPGPAAAEPCPLIADEARADPAGDDD